MQNGTFETPISDMPKNALLRLICVPDRCIDPIHRQLPASIQKRAEREYVAQLGDEC
jgi:hypothetical protein